MPGGARKSDTRILYLLDKKGAPMNEWINDAWQMHQNPWGEHRRLSLKDFVKRARTYLTPIQEAGDRLQRAYTLLSEWQTIRPEQCNEVISFIRTMDKTVEDFAQFLDQKSQMPLVLFSLRCPIVVELAYMKEQLWMVLALLGRFRSTCRSGSREVVRGRYEIICKLESLMQSNEDIIQLTQVMFDLARFQEQRDMAAIDSTLSSQNRCHSKSRPCSIYEFSSYHKKL